MLISNLKNIKVIWQNWSLHTYRINLHKLNKTFKINTFIYSILLKQIFILCSTDDSGGILLRFVNIPHPNYQNLNTTMDKKKITYYNNHSSYLYDAKLQQSPNTTA
ncbi:unnamed protein product [Rotaria socialis]